MLVRRLTTILPARTLAEAFETTRIHRVAGRTGDRTALVTNGRDRSSLCSSIATRTGMVFMTEPFENGVITIAWTWMSRMLPAWIIPTGTMNSYR